MLYLPLTIRQLDAGVHKYLKMLYATNSHQELTQLQAYYGLLINKLRNKGLLSTSLLISTLTARKLGEVLECQQ